MRNSKRFEGSRWVIFCAVVIGLFCGGQAQPDRRWELGAQLVIADFESLGEVPGGFGVRCVYNLNDYLALDGEVDYFPDHTRRGGAIPGFPGIRSEIHWPHGETEALAGLRAGFRFDGVGIGIFAKARPGIIRLTDYQTRWLTTSGKTRGILDLGGVVELYPASRLVIRFELGKVFMPLGDRYLSVDHSVTGPVVPWNLQGGVGFAVRF